jgi:uncharacterized protein YndB with AHSA1/START domain
MAEDGSFESSANGQSRLRSRVAEPTIFWQESLDRLDEYLAELQSGDGVTPMERSKEIGPSERTLKIERVFDAPPSLVFQAWIDPSQLARWWGPKGFTNPVCEVDPRVGGALRIVMRGGDGLEHHVKGVFLEIVTNHRLVFTNTATTPNGDVLIAGRTTVTFAGRDGKTLMVLETSATAMAPEAEAMLSGMDAGWRETLDRLTTLVDG